MFTLSLFRQLGVTPLVGDDVSARVDVSLGVLDEVLEEHEENNIEEMAMHTSPLGEEHNEEKLSLLRFVSSVE